jgi:TonB family protein
MDPLRFRFDSRWLRRAGIRLLQAAALALLVTMPARASDNRAVKSRVAPAYPEIAKHLKIEGVVKIEATVDPDGKVIDAKTLSGNRILAPAAEDAVRKWRFASAPVESKVTVEINFVVSP